MQNTMKRQSQSKEAEHFAESHLTDMNDVVDRFRHIITVVVVVVVVPQTGKKETKKENRCGFMSASLKLK